MDRARAANPPAATSGLPPNSPTTPHRSPAPSRTLGALLRATHPGPVVAVTTIATLLAVAAGKSAGTVVLVAAAVLCGQLCIGWSNDLLDADRDAGVGRTDKPSPPASCRARAARARWPWLPSRCARWPPWPLGLLSGLVHLVLGVGSGWAPTTSASSARRCRCCPTPVAFGAAPRAGVAGRRPGPAAAGLDGAAPAASWASARTCSTCCPTSPTTPPPACAGCRTASAPGQRPARARLPRRRHRPSSCSAPPAPTPAWALGGARRGGRGRRRRARCAPGAGPVPGRDGPRARRRRHARRGHRVTRPPAPLPRPRRPWSGRPIPRVPPAPVATRMTATSVACPRRCSPSTATPRATSPTPSPG